MGTINNSNEAWHVLITSIQTCKNGEGGKQELFCCTFLNGKGSSNIVIYILMVKGHLTL